MRGCVILVVFGELHLLLLSLHLFHGLFPILLLPVLLLLLELPLVFDVEQLLGLNVFGLGDNLLLILGLDELGDLLPSVGGARREFLDTKRELGNVLC